MHPQNSRERIKIQNKNINQLYKRVGANKIKQELSKHCFSFHRTILTNLVNKAVRKSIKGLFVCFLLEVTCQNFILEKSIELIFFLNTTVHTRQD